MINYDACITYSRINSWTSDIPHFLGQAKLTVVANERYPVRREYYKAWTDIQLMGCGELVETAVVPMTQKPGFDSPSAEEWRAMYRDLIEEVGKGASIVADNMVVVARKESG